MGPVVSEVSEQVEDVDFFKVDVDQSSDLAGKFGVQSIPTLILIKNKEEVDRHVGFIPEEQVKAFAEA
ncbi:thioredoxin family protein [Aquibacillus saliphilus]|uniref:thioredoxin family protein n=1 Tax=Aquibacillus saliphilus TaxID=1909422 RepID=UPI002106F2C7|nr:thioredoxin family protein [Aquibacillus saliphilus]